MLILFIILIVLALGSFGGGMSRPAYRTPGISIGTILLIVLVGSATELPFDWMPRLLAAGPHPSKIVAGAELREFIASAQIVTDASAVPSPPPSKGIFQVKPGS